MLSVHASITRPHSGQTRQSMPSSILNIKITDFPQYLHSVSIFFTPYIVGMEADLRLTPTLQIEPNPYLEAGNICANLSI